MTRGSCLCGAVGFEIEGRLTPIQYCHAARCQKATGSAFAPELAGLRARFRWVRGEELLTRYEAPLLREPPPYRRSFCRVCGSPMPVMLEGTDFVLMLAGVLDDDPVSRPFRHIFVSHGPAWHATHDDLPKHPERPPEAERLPRRAE
jgi:ADP-ribosyl-[dinitrogen reductase] hydrolase